MRSKLNAPPSAILSTEAKEDSLAFEKLRGYGSMSKNTCFSMKRFHTYEALCQLKVL